MQSFTFRLPRPTVYRIESSSPALQSTGPARWLQAWPDNGSTSAVEFGSRVVLQLKPSAELGRLLAGRPLQISRTVAARLYILQAPDALTAAREADALAQQPEVLASYPVLRRKMALHGRYAPLSNDPYFEQQWHLENRGDGGAPTGADLNVRAAWPLTVGEGVQVAVCDNGIELIHPELSARTAGQPHYNFFDRTADGSPQSAGTGHGTAVAGLIAAELNNHRGVAGVAPGAHLVSLVIFNAVDWIASDDALMDMFQYRSNTISIQNHSWGNADVTQSGPTLLEQTGISNAVTFGRHGKGVIMVRSGGNNRAVGGDTNDDGYPSDPRVIATGAVRIDGRAASYSSPGACLLVAAPSGDPDDGFATLFTTDRLGQAGFNTGFYTNDLADYGFDATGFSGTSGSAPLVSGVVALILSVNPELHYRDAQQILIHASRHVGLPDPDLTTNGAGYVVSHNVGFGVPDADQAVRLAADWPSRPPLTNITLTVSDVQEVPDDGLRLHLSGVGVPANLLSIRSVPSLGPHPDSPTPILPLANVGTAMTPITNDLTGQAALIQRGTNYFRDKIRYAADAGAVFAVIYNNVDGDQLLTMGGTDFVPIPAVLIGQDDGEGIVRLLETNQNVRAQLALDHVSTTLVVTNTLLCEHVGVTVTAEHPRRGDLRITLASPAGTRSVLQRRNEDSTPGPNDWTYYSTHHFYESSVGTWTVDVTDEEAGNVGSLTSVGLTIRGVPIEDADADGLDDPWESQRLGTLTYGPKDDPDLDGYSNMREQIVGTDPATNDRPLQLDLSKLKPGLSRLSWPSSPHFTYEVQAATNAVGPFNSLTNVPGVVGDSEWVHPTTDLANQYFRLRAVPKR